MQNIFFPKSIRRIFVGTFFVAFFIFGISAAYAQTAIPLNPWVVNRDTGTVYLRNSDSSVGIGTDAAQAKLHLYDSSQGIEGLIETDAIDKYARLILSNPKREFIITNNAVDDLVSFYYGGDNRLQFDTVNQWFNSGNVGIGTTSPRAPLEINSTVAPQLVIDAGVYGQDASKEAVLQLQAKTSGADNWRNNIVTDIHGNLILRKSVTTATDPTIDALVINSSGNVGIGTTSPGARLEVDGTIEAHGQLQIYNTSLSNYNGDYIQITRPTNDYAMLLVGDNSTYEALSLQPYGGTVGIGTTAPRSKLEINSTTAPQLVIDAGVYGQDASKEAVLQLQAKSPAADNWRNNIVTDVNGNLVFRKSVTTATDPTIDALVINSSGNVGIGSSEPEAKLQVGDSTQTSGVLMDVRAGLSSSVTPLSVSGGIGSGVVARFRDGNNNVRFLIQADGNIGIGKTDPQYPLDVNGTINIPNGDALRSSGNWLIGRSTDANNTIAVGSYSISNDIEFDSNGSARLFVNGTTGNVGIGTTNPTNKLTVQADRGGAAILDIFSDSIGKTTAIRMGDVNGSHAQIAFYDSQNQLDIGTSQDYSVITLRGDKVGINNLEPAYLLDVDGDISAYRFCIQDDCRNTWPDSGGGGESVWSSSGSNIYYTSGNVGIGDVALGGTRLFVVGSGANSAIDARSSSGTAIFAETDSASQYAIWGYNPSGIALSGRSVNSIAVYGESQNSYAGYFSGKAKVTGDLEIGGNITSSGDICIGKCE